VLNNIELKPVIYVTTESAPVKVIDSMKQKGLGEVLTHALGFVDAFHETVGLASPSREDTVDASSQDLTSLDIAISKQRERMEENVLLIFDSLTSPYLMTGAELLRFMRMTFSRFAAQGNAVLGCIDEGCGKSEDLVAMMSMADGVIKMETAKDQQLLDVVKHPKVPPSRIEVPLESRPRGPRFAFDIKMFNLDMGKEMFTATMEGNEKWMRPKTGDYVNLFWPTLLHWSGLLWDPKRFTPLKYEMNKADGSLFKEMLKTYPLPVRLMVKFMPKNIGKVRDMKKIVNGLQFVPWSKAERSGLLEYLEDDSKTDEHYFRVYESFDCWEFQNIGTEMMLYHQSVFAGGCKGYELMKGLERDWNAIETKCIGMGDPYCEFKVVPGEIDGLQDTLEKDNSLIEKIRGHLMDRLMGFLLHGKPLVLKRPTLGSNINLHAVMHAMGFPQLSGDRYKMALRMGGAKVGKEVGEHLMDAGLQTDETVKHLYHLLQHCKVGKVISGKTIRMEENCESIFCNKMLTVKLAEPGCYFTTGFLNGFFTAVKKQHVRETKCIVMGDPCCEWEFC
jgi:predicted hydrocarbon binding protein/KaiC/GvpD/RAD55 family RecA-like ATPase